MEKQKNVWKYYDDWKVHVTDSELMESICQTFNLMSQLDNCTKYYNGDLTSPVAWDIIVTNEQINDVKKYIKDFD